MKRWLPLPILVLSQILGSISCSDATDAVKNAETHVSCNDVCSAYNDCFDKNYDDDACADRCEDKTHDNGTEKDKLDDCYYCIKGKSCADKFSACESSCTGFVP